MACGPRPGYTDRGYPAPDFVMRRRGREAAAGAEPARWARARRGAPAEHPRRRSRWRSRRSHHRNHRSRKRNAARRRRSDTASSTGRPTRLAPTSCWWPPPRHPGGAPRSVNRRASVEAWHRAARESLPPTDSPSRPRSVTLETPGNSPRCVLEKRFTCSPRPRITVSNAPAIGTLTTARPGVRRHARRHRTCATAVVKSRSTPQRACFVISSTATTTSLVDEVKLYLAFVSPLVPPASLSWSRPEPIIGPPQNPSWARRRLTSVHDPGPQNEQQRLDRERPRVDRSAAPLVVCRA